MQYFTKVSESTYKNLLRTCYVFYLKHFQILSSCNDITFLNFEVKKLNKEESLSKTRFRFKFFKYNHNWTADFYEEMAATC